MLVFEGVPSGACRLCGRQPSHFDHDTLEKVLGDPSIIRTPGKFKGRNFNVEAVSD